MDVIRRNLRNAVKRRSVTARAHTITSIVVLVATNTPITRVMAAVMAVVMAVVAVVGTPRQDCIIKTYKFKIIDQRSISNQQHFPLGEDPP